jgi:hypothetical protein
MPERQTLDTHWQVARHERLATGRVKNPTSRTFYARPQVVAHAIDTQIVAAVEKHESVERQFVVRAHGALVSENSECKGKEQGNKHESTIKHVSVMGAGKDCCMGVIDPIKSEYHIVLFFGARLLSLDAGRYLSPIQRREKIRTPDMQL